MSGNTAHEPIWVVETIKLSNKRRGNNRGMSGLHFANHSSVIFSVSRYVTPSAFMSVLH